MQNLASTNKENDTNSGKFQNVPLVNDVAGSEGQIALKNTVKALLNILDDYSAEKNRAKDTQRALLNIMEDSTADRMDMKNMQRAILNILEDYGDEKGKVENINKDLASLNEELETFSFSISHDLRAPLRAITGFANILQEDYASKMDVDGKSYLNAILNNSKRAGELIDDILAFSRLGREQITTSEINMTDLVQSVIEEETGSNSNEIEFTIDELLPSMGDRALVKQVWVNLISNAIKYSKNESKNKIKIGSYYKENLIYYYVKDEGVGFDMIYYDKLFGVFERLHSREEFEGTGIGLAIVQRIIERHGGSVWAESKLNEGSCFYFSLPNINL